MLREAAELSKINAETGLTIKQEENRANYNNLIENFVRPEMKLTTFDPNSIEEKIKNLKFANKNGGDGSSIKKDPNWFKNMSKGSGIKNLKIGVSKEDEE